MLFYEIAGKADDLMIGDVAIGLHGSDSHIRRHPRKGCSQQRRRQ